ncbi:SLC13 family permease [Saccharopolyspora hattusasensis]|uniref:SLC13 family permease n=1 Tax=Saccharopolyspora hattusasensis TaxID=1128679 RepID=UPI003D977D39
MTVQFVAIGILVLVFVLGAVRGVHIGALALTAAVGVGLTLGRQPLEEVLGGFPVSLMVLLLGMTYLIAIARANGTLDWLVDGAVRRTGRKKFLLPWLMFVIALVIAGLGNPLAALIVIPIAMLLAEKNGRDPMVMGLGAVNGSIAGAFAPTSLYGVLTVSIGELGGVVVNPYAQFAFVLALVVALQVAAQILFRRHRTGDAGDSTVGIPAVPLEPIGGGMPSGSSGASVSTAERVERTMSSPARATRTTLAQRFTLLCLASLVVIVIAVPAFGITINIGTVALALGVVLSLAFPRDSAAAIADIDWSTILLVGGIVTYVALLQRMGAVDALGDLAAAIPSPLVAVLMLCFVGALVSAFASTTALLPIIIPLSLPLIAEGGISAAGLIIALSVSATIVDSTPFSTSGAVMVACTPEADRPRVTRALLRWGLSMTVIGPLVTCAALVIPSLL